MHPLQRFIAANNNADWTAFTPLLLAGRKLGLVHGDVATALLKDGLLRQDSGALTLSHEAADTETRTKQLHEILLALVAKGLVPRERKELYPVALSYTAPPVALADRALMPALGFLSCGIHCNAYVGGLGAEELRDSTVKSPRPLVPESPSPLKLWIARRSLDSATDPGKLDHLVAGGQPYGLTLEENLAKEAWEEAGVPKELVKAAIAAGSVTYSRQQKHMLRRDTLFLFDLELPAGFTPKNQDGEVLDFRRMDIAEVLKLLLDSTNYFKFNVPLVLIDFLIRHGYIAANEPGFAALKAGLQGRHSP
jgi:8-oxo-dGTP pyrophosphatase MutT (NUDIX family)